MKIIISPAKKMNIDPYSLPYKNLPLFFHEAEQIKKQLKSLSYEELKSLWCCNDKIASSNYENLQSMDLKRNLTPAILAYEGIQYQYMAPAVFEEGQFQYIESHLRILSGFYGLLCPFDGVVPYRLEMQAKLCIDGHTSLYSFWNDRIAKQIFTETDTIINLASKEYSKCITKYMPKDANFINCVFGELIDGKIVEKGTLCKMARGEMVRFMAENNIEAVKEIQGFKKLGYAYSKRLSDENNYIFIKKKNKSSVK